MDELRLAAARRAGAAVTGLVGDGCVVRLHDRRNETLEAVAVDHRDRHRRAALRDRLADTSIPMPGGWAGEPLRKGITLRLGAGQAPAAVGADAGAAIAAPLRLDGDPIGVVVALRDETEDPYTAADQELVERLAAGADRLAPPRAAAGHAGPPGAGAARVLEHAAVGVWAIDAGGVTTYVNEPLCDLLGVPSCVLEGERAAPFLDAALGGGAGPLGDHCVQRPDGTGRWVEVTSAPLTDEHGAREGTVITIVDVDARRRSQVGLRLRAAASESLAELAQHALEGEAFDALARASAEAVRDVLDADAAAVGHVSPDRGTYTLRASAGWDETLTGVALPLGERTPAWFALGDDEPFVVDDYEATALVRRGELVAERGLRSVACVSVAGGAGVISAHSREVAPFDEAQIGFLRSVARILAVRWQPLAVALSSGAVA
jgi:GAF domain/PAS fold